MIGMCAKGRQRQVAYEKPGHKEKAQMNLKIGAGGTTNERRMLL